MSYVKDYTMSVLHVDDCRVVETADNVVKILRAWRKGRVYANSCTTCESKLTFPQGVAFQVCCDKFYHRKFAGDYTVNSIAIPTPGYKFVLNHLEKLMKSGNQEFVVLPDPIFWQMVSTLVFEKVMKFATGKPITNRTDSVLPNSRSSLFYEQMILAPLNYGSMSRRHSGKEFTLRKHGCGKRCHYAMRGMIVPDATLKPNEIRLPLEIVEEFNLSDLWIILNRMPSLTPESFVSMKVKPEGWNYDVIGLPLEIVEAINGDFDGDECNVYIVSGVQSQVECATLLNSEEFMGCFVTGLKLSPCQDLLSAYFLHYEDVDFLPYKSRNLKKTMQVVYDLYGSRKTFECFDRLRTFYLKAFQEKTCFALTLGEMERLHETAVRAGSIEEFEKQMPKDGCLVTQVLSESKGSVEHLYQLFGKIGKQHDVEIENSFWSGMDPVEFVAHATTANEALQKTTNIWMPGYGYYKCVYSLHGLHVDYLGRLVDGKTCVIEKDALRALKHTDLMSEEAFSQLLNRSMTK